jgi:copper chaperone CopZ
MRRVTLVSQALFGMLLAAGVAFDKKTATVTYDPDKATSAKLTQATTEAGFPSKLVAKP